MNTKEILSIVALTALGLCLLCCLAKAAMKSGDKSKKHCDKACGAFVFLAIILLAVSQLMGDPESMEISQCYVPKTTDTRTINVDFETPVVIYKEATETDFTVTAKTLPKSCNWNEALGKSIVGGRQYKKCYGANSTPSGAAYNKCAVQVVGGNTKNSLIQCGDTVLPGAPGFPVGKLYARIEDLCSSV
jgi:hypothetical protein